MDYATEKTLPLSKRIDQWEEHLDRVGFGGRTTPHWGYDFEAKLSAHPLGDNTMLRFSQSRGSYQRTDVNIRTQDRESLGIILLLQGSVTLRQFGREVDLSPGDCCLVDTGEAFSAENDHFRSASLTYNKATARGWLPDIRSACALNLRRASPWGRALASTLFALSSLDNSSDIMAIPANTITDHINCLIALATAPHAPKTGTYRSSLFQRLLLTLRNSAADAGFDPAQCAAISGMSLRSLHMAFAKNGTSFGRELKTIRMQMAQRYLEDATFDRKTISEIAALCGFTYPANFITCFKKTHGLPPDRYRRNR